MGFLQNEVKLLPVSRFGHTARLVGELGCVGQFAQGRFYLNIVEEEQATRGVYAIGGHEDFFAQLLLGKG